MPDDGFVTIRGAHSAREAIARVEAELDAKRVTVFTKIDHAAGAVAVGLPLRPTALIIFGAHARRHAAYTSSSARRDRPSAEGTLLEDGLGMVWLTHTDPAWIARRHALDARIEPIVRAMSAMLAAVNRNAIEAGPDLPG